MSDYSGQVCLPQLIRARALAHPDRIAVSGDGERLTFGRLDSRAAEIGGFLRDLGVVADQPVGVFMEPSVEIMVGVWGISYAGAAYLPLSTEYPDERLTYMVTDARVGIVLADEHLRPRLEQLVPAGTTIVTPQSGRGHKPVEQPGPVDPDSLAYVIYTSGSSGRPKGIMISHRSIVSQLRWMAGEHGLDARRTVLQKTPVSFDAAQWEILAPACGSHVVMSEPGAYRNPERLIELLRAHEITTLQGVPTLLQALCDTGELAGCTALRQVFSGGEALSRALALELLEALPAAELVNLYGPSECTINSSSHRVDRATVAAGPEVISIGAPVTGTAYYILDAGGVQVPPGEVGELHIAGVQVARGYLHRPDLTAERFVPNPYRSEAAYARLYRTGDLARWNADGNVQFAGRTDSQVKLRGFRVELDEIRVAIERHAWVKRAAVIVRDDARTGANLVAFIELNPAEAALMDQGNHGAHHVSKQSRLQARAQLSDPGLRSDGELAGRSRVELPGRTETVAQRRLAFARKTYRFFEGGDVTRADLLRLLAPEPAPVATGRGVGSLSLAELGTLLRNFGQFRSSERLLPKYGYASPGSLYATQLHLELAGVAGLAAGHYYYHPGTHELVLIEATPEPAGPRLRVHFIGRRAAIEPVYRDNIEEVLRIETGHMVGHFDAVLPGYGLAIGAAPAEPAVAAILAGAGDDYYLGTFEVSPAGAARAGDGVEFYLQAHPGRVADLPGGLYRLAGDRFEPVSGEMVGKRHVIAINQQVYERASFGVTLLSRDPDPWRAYVAVGRALQRLQLDEGGLGLMSSGYSSCTGHPLLSARRIAEILGETGETASYFAIGGRVSAEQRRSEGMKEDVVHMRGPAEIIRDDLADQLPHYMVPNRVTVLDAFPQTANGKVDNRALSDLDASSAASDVPVVAPRTPTEEAIAALWAKALKQQVVSVQDDFFAAGGNSLVAVSLITRINRVLGCALPLQVPFESPTIEQLARRIDRDSTGTASRLVPLRPGGNRRPIFCWPGLGGYPMNLRLLAHRVHAGRPFFGVQAYGVNAGEVPYPGIAEMAAADVALIRQRQPSGPYTLWGYSFGARVAVEAAYQLEQAGEQVDGVVLIAAGKPPVSPTTGAPGRARLGDDQGFTAILFSVFAGSIDHPALQECMAVATDDDTFISYVCKRFDYLDCELVRRIVGVVRQTFDFEYGPGGTSPRHVDAPVTLLRARGDQESFVEAGQLHTGRPARIVPLAGDHYALLRSAGIDELVDAIHSVHAERKAHAVPHVSIKHFPRTLGATETSDLVAKITDAVRTAFACEPGAISIALEPIGPDAWTERVYDPEIVNGRGTLVKAPNY